MDPFLQWDSQIHSFPLPDIVIPKGGAFGDRCLVSEEPTDPKQIPFLMDIDADEDERPIVIVNPSHFGVEVQRSKGGNEFMVKVEGRNGDALSVVANIADQNGCVKIVHFLFHLENDTSVSDASEMVDKLNLAEKNVMFIAELLDLLLVNLIPTWKPSVPISPVAAVGGLPTNEQLNVESPSVEISTAPPGHDSSMTGGGGVLW